MSFSYVFIFLRLVRTCQTSGFLRHLNLRRISQLKVIIVKEKLQKNGLISGKSDVCLLHFAPKLPFCLVAWDCRMLQSDNLSRNSCRYELMKILPFRTSVLGIFFSLKIGNKKLKRVSVFLFPPLSYLPFRSLSLFVLNTTVCRTGS